MKEFKLTILHATMERIRKDESGESTVKYLQAQGLSAEEEYRYFREAERRIWIEPWETAVNYGAHRKAA